jgi:hypothetical protein
MGYANARLTFYGRCLLVRCVRMEGRPVAHVAVAPGHPGSARTSGCTASMAGLGRRAAHPYPDQPSRHRPFPVTRRRLRRG